MKLKERLFARVEKTEGCWLWRGAVLNRGYGIISIRGRRSTAHRVSYEVHNGPIPDGMVVMHQCDTPNCVRPDHLKLGTRADNNAERDSRGRQVTGRAWMPLMERFWLNVQQTDTCWLWKGALGDGSGYGVITEGGRLRGAHRIAYVNLVGPIPDGMVVMHVCDIPSCVNPDHLKLGTRAENMADMKAKGRHAHGATHGHVGGIEFTDPEARARNIKEALNRPETRARLTEARIETWASYTQEQKDEIFRKISEAEKGKEFTPEHLANLQAAHAARRGTDRSVPWNKGVPMSEETRQKVSEAKKGQGLGGKMSDEARRKISEARKGMKFSEEHLRNMSLSRLGKKRPCSDSRRQAIIEGKRLARERREG